MLDGQDPVAAVQVSFLQYKWERRWKEFMGSCVILASFPSILSLDILSVYAILDGNLWIQECTKPTGWLSWRRGDKGYEAGFSLISSQWWLGLTFRRKLEICAKHMPYNYSDQAVRIVVLIPPQLILSPYLWSHIYQHIELLLVNDVPREMFILRNAQSALLIKGATVTWGRLTDKDTVNMGGALADTVLKPSSPNFWRSHSEGNILLMWIVC